MGKVLEVPAGGELSSEQLQELAQAARNAKIIVFPTDTVYGIGSNGLIRAASRRIYEIKVRDSMKPLPILVHSAEEAWKWVEPTPAARALAARFWPGPLTLVLKPTKAGRVLTLPEFGTLAVRVPAHPLLAKLIEASGVPWASTSANMSGSPAIADGASAAAAFAGAVDYVVSAGRAGGTESTVVDAASEPPRVLREGALSGADILGALAR